MNDLQPNNILIYRADDNRIRLEVKLEDKIIWLSQKQIGELYQKSKATISEHIKHIFEDGELDANSVVRYFRTTAEDGKNYNVAFYNLDLILAVGYREWQWRLPRRNTKNIVKFKKKKPINWSRISIRP